MATLRDSGLFSFFLSFSKKPAASVQSRRAREFSNSVYKEMGGPTPRMKRFYEELLENERRSRAEG